MAPAAPTLLILLVLGLGAPRAVAAPDPARRSPVVRAVERAGPAVVNVSTAQVVEQRSPFPFAPDPFFEEFFRDFPDPRPPRTTRTSLGSGVIVDANGTIVTNLHVILRASRIHVTLVDERELEAELVGADADSDLAVLRVHAGAPLPHVTLGTARDLLIGETVIAIGNPFGLAHTVTTGVVSAQGRLLREGDRVYSDLIQTDASINPGNSGGPLLNILGELVGINTAIYGKAQGIGFAIPVDRVRRVMRELVSYGEVRHIWTGVEVQDLTPELQAYFGTRRGVVVTDVEPESPAAAAGLSPGDVIVAIDGRDAHSADTFALRMRDHADGDEVRLRIRRDGREHPATLRVTVYPPERADAVAWDRLGIAVEADERGLVVARIRRGGPAARIGVVPGDRLLGLGGAPVTTITELRRRLYEVRRAHGVILSIGRGRYQYNVRVPLA